MNEVTRHLRIEGRVQGVYFRESMAREARKYGLRGWVRNRVDGTVEAVIQGDEEGVLKLIGWAHRGPATARVDTVIVGEGSGDFEEFEKRPTA